ncbi:calcium/sodium antiporter [Parvularcula dongshanensis]|uniref:Cation:H+ antiporter n=1 Tax=Parvularcula dongshanensis TaxID=1173995 RepID=A0A840I686_9PROT|nr:calcium/sodium antiporter [Parvularcula dongshanensis]MBB4659825.1 cation:H+ antiporter [Parvularcula dongshanensis]
MLTETLLLLAGLALLLVAGDFLVRGAVGLAKLLNVPPLLIGLTVVAFGTSAPELVVTIQAVLSGDNGIAMGNIVGSNIANILLVLGLPAVISAISLKTPRLGRHAVVMLIATAAFCAFVYARGAIDTLAGAVLLSLIAAYLVLIWREAKAGENAELVAEVEEFGQAATARWKPPLYLVVGLVGLPIGAQLLVENGAAIAEALGVREEVIGLTVVAFGTSLPELATVIAAAMKREADVAVGNIVGSNIFNLLFVGGVAGLVGTSAFSSEALRFDLPVMVGAALILSFLIFRRSRIGRLLGIFFTLAYVAYIAALGMGVA